MAQPTRRLHFRAVVADFDVLVPIAKTVVPVAGSRQVRFYIINFLICDIRTEDVEIRKVDDRFDRRRLRVQHLVFSVICTRERKYCIYTVYLVSMTAYQ